MPAITPATSTRSGRHRVRIAGASFQESLRLALSPFDEVGDVRGRGFFIGIELVADRRTKMPFPPQRAMSFDIVGHRCCFFGSSPDKS